MNSYTALTYSGSFICSSISLHMRSISLRFFLALVTGIFPTKSPFIINCFERYLKAIRIQDVVNFMNFRAAILNSGSRCHSFILCQMSLSKFFGFINQLYYSKYLNQKLLSLGIRVTNYEK